MNTSYFLDYHPNWFVEWCRRKYGPRIQVTFDVIDSIDSSIKLTSFTLKMNGNVIPYEVVENNDIRASVPQLTPFTIQITNVEGYVDGVANTYTYQTLNGSHVGMTRKSEQDGNAEFKLDWDITIANDLDSHMVIKDKNGNELGHVSYAEKDYQDNTTSVRLDVDNVTRQGDKPPEILTITNINDDYLYYYYVHDYSETQKLPKSNLNLNVVINNQTVDPPMQIPTEDNPNCYWNVCVIKDGILERASDYMLSTVTESPNTSY